MSKTILTYVDGWTPMPDLLVTKYGRETASVWGAAWRYCQMSDGICRASMEKIGKRIGLSRQSTQKHMNILVDDGFFEDTTPDLKNKPHIYRDTGKVSMYNRFGIGVNLLDSGGKQIDSECQVSLHEDSIKETIKEKSSANAGNGQKPPPSWGIEAAIFAGVPVTNDHLFPEEKQFERLAFGATEEICHNAEHLRDLAMTFMLSARKLPQAGKIGYWRKSLQQFVDHKPFPIMPIHVQEAVRRARRDKLTIYTPDSVYKVAGDLSDEKWMPETDPEMAGAWAGRDEDWRNIG